MRTRATGLVVALALLWGSGFFWIRLALDGFTPVQLTFARLALGALVLVPIVLLRRPPWPSGRRMWAHVAVSALLASALPYSLFAFAEQTVPSSVAGVVNATTPLWTVLIAIGVLGAGARLSWLKVLGVAIGFAGVVVIVEPWRGIVGGSIAGLAATVLAALSYATAYVYQERFLTNRGISPLSLTAAQLLVATGMLALVLPFSASGIEPTPAAAVAVLILGTAGTGLALVINYTLITTEGATSASVVTYLVPLVALLLGIVLLDEQGQWTLLGGAALILLGVALARAKSSRTSA